MSHSSLRLITSNKKVESTSIDTKYPQSIIVTLDKLNELIQLEDNWDTYGGLSPTKEAIHGAFSLALDLFEESTPPPDIFPVPNGNIQFEWSCFGLDLEIEVESNRKNNAAFRNLDTDEQWEKQFTFDYTELRNIIGELSARNTKPKVLRVVNA